MFLLKPYARRLGARLFGRRKNKMDVILHVGAHGTASTNLAAFFARHEVEAKAQNVAFWGADRTRSGLFSGLMAHKNSILPDTPRARDRATQRIRMELDRLEKSGVEHLIVSEPAMIGTMAHNLQHQSLYPQFLPRLERFFDAFGDHCSQIAFSIRCYESYWTAALAHAIPRGFSAPSEETADRLVTQPRRWRNLLQEAKQVFPKAERMVWPYEALAGHPERQVALMTGAVIAPSRADRPWLNSAPSDKQLLALLEERAGDKNGAPQWPPFQAHHVEGLRAQYRDDLSWLRAEHNEDITYVETAGEHRRFQNDTDSQDVAETFSAHLRGQPNDREERRMV
jgi:hypothetical protein